MSHDPDDSTAFLEFSWWHNASGATSRLSTHASNWPHSNVTLHPHSLCADSCFVQFSVLGAIGAREASAVQLVEFIAGDPPVAAVAAPLRCNPQQMLTLLGGAVRQPICPMLSAVAGDECRASFSWSVGSTCPTVFMYTSSVHVYMSAMHTYMSAVRRGVKCSEV